jgi:tRNA (guanine10-N2)-methyltransferase
MPTYLLHYALSHVSFRLSELTSVAKMYGFAHTMRIVDMANLDDRKPSDISQENASKAARPFIVVELENEAQAMMLANRCILIK